MKAKDCTTGSEWDKPQYVGCDAKNYYKTYHMLSRMHIQLVILAYITRIFFFFQRTFSPLVSENGGSLKL